MRTFQYDNLSRLISATNGARYNGALYNQGVYANTKSWQYDAGSRATQVTFPEGTSLFRSFTKIGQLAQVVDIYGNTTGYQYLSDGSLAQVTYTDVGTPMSYSFGYSYELGR